MRVLSPAILGLILLLAGLPVQGADGKTPRQGSGRLQTRTLSWNSFQAIDLTGDWDLDIRLGDKQSCQVTLDDNLWDLFEAQIQGTWLNLSWGRPCQPSTDGKIQLVVPALTDLKIKGGGVTKITRFHGPVFRCEISGAGDLTMQGQVERLELNVGGAGNANTLGLKAMAAKVIVAGAGKAEVFVREKLQGRVTAVGQLIYAGHPAEVDTRSSGLGTILSR